MTTTNERIVQDFKVGVVASDLHVQIAERMVDAAIDVMIQSNINTHYDKANLIQMVELILADHRLTQTRLSIRHEKINPYS